MNAELHNHAPRQRWLQRAALLLTAVALAACTTMPMVKRPKKPAAPATRPLPGEGTLQNFAGACQQTDIDGFGENATLRVAGGQVQQLDWHVKVGKRGQCHFNLRDFRQTKNAPHIELISRSRGACKLLIYQDARRVTLAHANCQSFCTPRSVAEEAWPVMFNPQTGRCASLNR